MSAPVARDASSERGRSVAIMQPYFLPYIGYFQLMAVADTFVVYDTIKYTKKGWINRNRHLRDGGAETFSLPLRQATDDATVDQRTVAPEFDPDRLLRRWDAAYRHAPHRDDALPVLQRIVRHPDRNLFSFLLHSLHAVRDYLDLTRPMLRASDVESRGDLRGAARVLGLVGDVGATTYINPIGGVGLYDTDAFARHGVRLRFLRARLTPYPQGAHAHVPALSIVDLMMHLPRDTVRDLVRTDWSWVDATPDPPLPATDAEPELFDEPAG
jgi:hypothetical protein